MNKKQTLKEEYDEVVEDLKTAMLGTHLTEAQDLEILNLAHKMVDVGILVVCELVEKSENPIKLIKDIITIQTMFKK